MVSVAPENELEKNILNEKFQAIKEELNAARETIAGDKEVIVNGAEGDSKDRKKLSDLLNIYMSFPGSTRNTSMEEFIKTQFNVIVLHRERENEKEV